MRRREDKAITKHSVNLYAGDYPRLMALYGTRVGASKIIRDIVHAHLRKIEESAARKAPLEDDLDLDLEEYAHE